MFTVYNFLNAYATSTRTVLSVFKIARVCKPIIENNAKSVYSDVPVSAIYPILNTRNYVLQCIVCLYAIHVVVFAQSQTDFIFTTTTTTTKKQKKLLN